MKTETINHIIYHIGRNAKENWDVYDDAEPDDILFHLKDDSSPYVIMEVRNDKILYDSLREGAMLCKKYSKYKDNKKNIKVIYCNVKHLKKGRIIGEIIIDEEHVNEMKI